MIKFFRKIRQKLLSENRFSQYLIYAIGEIILVVIGILIALQINNWNENRKSKKIENQIYRDLKSALVKDSTEVNRIIKIQTKSLETQRTLILNEATQQPFNYDENNLNELLQEIINGVYSFFPKSGIYNSIVSNDGMSLLKSNEIKASLINLYDHQYKRYANMDVTIENKYHYQLLPIINKKIGWVEYIPTDPDPELFQENFEELVSECRNLNSVLNSNRDLLVQISEDINELLELIDNEIKK